MPDAGVKPGAVFNTGHPVDPGRDRGAPAQHLEGASTWRKTVSTLELTRNLLM